MIAANNDICDIDIKEIALLKRCENILCCWINANLTHINCSNVSFKFQNYTKKMQQKLNIAKSWKILRNTKGHFVKCENERNAEKGSQILENLNIQKALYVIKNLFVIKLTQPLSG